MCIYICIACIVYQIFVRWIRLNLPLYHPHRSSTNAVLFSPTWKGPWWRDTQRISMVWYGWWNHSNLRDHWVLNIRGICETNMKRTAKSLEFKSEIPGRNHRKGRKCPLLQPPPAAQPGTSKKMDGKTHHSARELSHVLRRYGSGISAGGIDVPMKNITHWGYKFQQIFGLVRCRYI